MSAAANDDPVGIVFDIKEFSLYDGPGLRCTVFLKGCPLRCTWCHNPEGQNHEPEVMKSASGDRLVGTRQRASELESKILSYVPIFAAGNGGVTFSGGEPLSQAGFVINAMKRLKGKVHLLLQTSGHADASAFDEAASLADEVYFDVKLIDNSLHRAYTGMDNSLILENLRRLDRSGQSYRLRFPLIPGVTDLPENYENIRNFVDSHLKNCGGLDLLPYNQSAGGKYSALGRTFEPNFDETQTARVEPDFFRTVLKDVRAL
jgi:pyruvate formate lyase activating enzyme